MRNEMFCFQCEQSAGCTGCTGPSGVCGKSAHTAALQDELTGALIGLARAADHASAYPAEVDQLILDGLFTTVTNVNFDPAAIHRLIEQIHEAKAKLTPQCAACASPCGHHDDYPMQKLWNAPEDIRSLKSLILFGIRGRPLMPTTLELWDIRTGS